MTGRDNVKLNEELPNGVPFEGEVPIVNYVNRLYLISKQGQAIQSNIGDIEYISSVIAIIDHIIERGIPIIHNLETYGKPIKTTCNIDLFKQIELQLIDFQYQPVLLMSPMFVTIKVKSCDNPKMKLV